MFKLNFELTPEQAVSFLRSKGVKVTENWLDLFRSEHDFSFTVAKEQRLLVLQYILDNLTRGLEEGLEFEEFKDNLEASISEQWSRRRLQNIFRTNILSSYQAQHYKSLSEVKDDRPYWQYIAIRDARVRLEHLKWNGITLPADSEWWKTHFPPNGFQCRCSVRSLSETELNRDKIKLSKEPKIEYETITLPDGRVERIVKGIDRGFDYIPGQKKYEIDKDKFDKRIGDLL